MVASEQGGDGGCRGPSPFEVLLEVGEEGAYRNCQGWRKGLRREVVASIWVPVVVKVRGREVSLCVSPFVLAAAWQ